MRCFATAFHLQCHGFTDQGPLKLLVNVGPCVAYDSVVNPKKTREIDGRRILSCHEQLYAPYC